MIGTKKISRNQLDLNANTQTVASSATVTPTSANDLVVITAQAVVVPSPSRLNTKSCVKDIFLIGKE